MLELNPLPPACEAGALITLKNYVDESHKQTLLIDTMLTFKALNTDVPCLCL